MRFTRRSFRKVGVPLLVGVWTAVILSLAGCGRTPTPVDNGSQNVPVAGGGGGGAAPIVTSTVPVGNASTVSLNSSVTATFSGTVDPTSIADNTFNLQTVGGTDHIPGTLSFVGGTAKFTPSSPLTPSTSYLATVTGVTSLGGVPMAGDTKWMFSTTSSLVSSGPTVRVTTPADLDNNVGTTVPITFTFSEDMDPSTLVAGTTVKLQGTGGAVAGTVSYTGMTGKFTPSGALASSTTYLFTVTTGALSRFGVPLAETKTVTFTTVASAGSLAPAIDTTNPNDGAVGVSVSIPITFTFNQNIDPSTLVAGTTVKLQGTGGVVTGTVSYADNVGKFTPSAALAPSTTYLFTVTTGVLSRSGVPMAQAKTLMFTTAVSAGGTLVPAVISTIPTDGKDNVLITEPITFTFNQNIDPSTLVVGTTVKLQGTGGAVAGTVTYADNVGTFTPSGSLAPVTTYLFTVTTGVRSRSGIPMAQDNTLMFTTSSSGPVAPSIEYTIPGQNATGVTWDNTITPITIVFSQDIDPSTLVAGTTIYLETTDGAPVPGTVSYTRPNGTFTPSAFLAPGTSYMLTVTTGVKNRSGIPMAQKFTTIFTTSASAGLAIDISTLSPAPFAPNVPVDNNVTFTFNQDINPASLIASVTNNLIVVPFPSINGPPWRASVYLQTAGPIWVGGTVTMLGRTGTFNPTTALSPNTTYVFTVTTDVKNLSGVGMAQEYKWIFTTATAP